MPTLFLHVGLHKTGTTSLQKAFFDNRAALERQGFLYPRTGLSPKPVNWGHHELAYALRHRPQGTEMWQALRKEADDAGLPNVVVSSEELSLLPFASLPGPAPFKLISQIFEGYDVRLICYLRPQAEMISSLYNHHVKSVGEKRDILEFIAQVAPRLDYQNYLNVAAHGLGTGAIEVRLYQKSHMKNGDIISDMADRLGIDLTHGFTIRQAALNSGLTREGLQAMLEANRRLAGDPEQLKAERTAIIERHRAPAFYRHQLLSDEILQVIEALYRNKNRQISRRFLGRNEPLFSVSSEAEALT